MEDEPFGTTLAYSKSRKTSKRTTFQDELQAAISARAQRSRMEEKYPYDFDDEDDILKELLNSTLKKSRAFKLDKTKSKINDFRLSDEEEENVRPKRVSFLKTKTQASPTPGPCDSGGTNTDAGQESSTLPSHSRTRDPEAKESIESESGQWEPAAPTSSDTDEDRGTLAGGDSVPLSTPQGLTHTSLTGLDFEDIVPKPRPRQRMVQLCNNAEEENEFESGTCAAGPHTSPVSAPLTPTGMTSQSGRQGTSRSSSSLIGQDNDSEHVSHLPGLLSAQEGLHEEVGSISPMVSRCCPSAGETVANSLQKSADPSLTGGERCDVEDAEAGNIKVSTFLGECQEDSADGAPSSMGIQSRGAENSSKIRPLSSRSVGSLRSRVVRPHTAESKYLGTLKVLDHKACVQDYAADDADSLRATIYQEWLKIKNEKMKETLQVKRQEEKLLAERKNEEALAKKGEAQASFEAWKGKKVEVIKEKMKQDHEMIRKQQAEMEEKVEKRDTARKVFDTWKAERDRSLKEKHRSEKEAVNQEKLKQQEDKEERKKESAFAFTKWSETKGERIRERVTTERRQKRFEEKEEKKEKAEKEKMALEVYEKWLKRKERHKRRERRQKRIREILLEPPPPWSPPSRTVPFGK